MSEVTYLLWDASSLVKKYYAEPGAETVDAIFASSRLSGMTVTFMGYAETSAILRRKFNGGLILPGEFQQARLLLQSEVLLNPGFDLLTITDRDILDGMTITDRHNLNTADAAMLSAYVRYGQAAPAGLAACRLVASDKRLIRAAEAEGLLSLNPEIISPAELSARLQD